MEFFPNVTDNLILNFCNSCINRNGKNIELIKDLNSLQIWTETPIDNQPEYNYQLSVFNSFLDDVNSKNELVNFRDELHSMLTAFITDKNQFEKITIEIENFLVTRPFRIVFIEGIPLQIPTTNGIDGIKTLLFLSLTELIQSKDIWKLSTCSNECCPLMFINSSGRRKWCSMKICGNRNKVERFDKKQKGSI